MSDSFTIESDTLKREVQVAKEFSPRDAMVRLTVSDKGAFIAASDKETCLVHQFKAHAAPESPFDALIPADHLLKIAKGCPGTLTLETASLGGEPCAVIRHSEATLKTANLPPGSIESEFRLYTGDVAAFPKCEPLPADKTIFSIRAADLLECVNWALPSAISTSRFGIVLCQEGTRELTVMGTNGRVLASFGKVKIKGIRQSAKLLVLPYDLADRLVTVLGREAKADPSAAVEVRLADEGDCVSFVGNGWLINSTASAEFPEVALGILKRQDTHYATATASDFRNAIAQVVKAASAKDPLLRLHIRPQGIAVAIAGEERIISAGTYGEEVEVRMPMSCLKPWLKRLPKGDWVGICAVDLHSPTIFLCESRLNTAWAVAGQKAAPKPASAPAEAGAQPEPSHG